ncbi:MAG: BMP family lipoprotein [Catonella sp.]|uniref:BMP family lipoprotein n=1 Tax=Catonella sp. TaxID=2382125 RepID=UPI003F9F8973
MGKILRFFASLVAGTLILTACNGTGIISTSEKVKQGFGLGMLAKEEGLKIAILSSPSGVDDGNFNQDIYEGIEAFIAKHPDSVVTPIRELTGEADAAIETLSDVAGEYDVLVCCGFQFSGLVSIAKDYPNKKFILVDGHPVDEHGNEVVCDNVYAMEFKEQESGFLAGISAALETRTKKVAVVTGKPFPSNVNYQLGFEAGVNYANTRYHYNVECVAIKSYAGVDVRGVNVGGNYIGSFSDKDKGSAITKELLAKGCDIIFAAAGDAGMGVFETIKEDVNTKRLKVIGCDTDQYDYGKNGNNNIVLTSAIKKMNMNVEKQLVNILEGTFKGENALLGADTDSTGCVKEKERSYLQGYTLYKINEAYNLIKIGEIVPPSNFNEMTPEAFIGLRRATRQNR